MRPAFPAAIAFLLLAGCASLRPAIEPEGPAPVMPDRWMTPASTHAASGSGGWTRFADARLQALQARALAGNPDLLIAARRLRAADAALLGALAGTAPQVSLLGEPADAATASANDRRGTFGLGVAARYEFDLWGRLDDRIVAAGALRQASAEDLDAARLALQLAVARADFGLRTLDALVALAVERQAIAADQERLVNLRVDAGRAALGEGLAAASRREQAQADEDALLRERAEARIALALLLGEAPESSELPPVPDDPGAPLPDVPAGVPAALIARRADLRAAGQRLRAAQADVAAAEADLLPRLSLTAELGVVSGSLRDLVGGSRALVGVGPELGYAIYDGGLGAAQVDAQDQAREMARLEYARAVRNALAEVERALLARTAALKEADRLTRLQEAAARQVQLADLRSGAGRVSRLDTLPVRAEQLDLEAARLRNRQAQLESLLDLQAALGGDWSAPDAPQ